MPTSLSPRAERFVLLTLAGIQFSHILDFMIMMPLGPILMSAFAIGPHEFGLLVASYSFSAALSGLLAATFVDLFERNPSAHSVVVRNLPVPYSYVGVVRGLLDLGRAARAVEVVQYLITQGMTSSNIGAAGYGENDPVADNANEDGKAQNRRIEVILMPLLGDIPELKAMLTGGKS
jgi:MFS family permease